MKRDIIFSGVSSIYNPFSRFFFSVQIYNKYNKLYQNPNMKKISSMWNIFFYILHKHFILSFNRKKKSVYTNSIKNYLGVHKVDPMSQNISRDVFVPSNRSVHVLYWLSQKLEHISLTNAVKRICAYFWLTQYIHIYYI